MGLRVWAPPPATPVAVVVSATSKLGLAADAPTGAPNTAFTSAAAPAAVPNPSTPARAARATRPASAPATHAPPSAPALPQRAVLQRADGDAIAKMDWPALRDAVAVCQACDLCESRSQTVFGVGHQEAQWMVVGEAPGEQEDLAGQPFVGPSGQLLDRMLAALGLTRSEEGDLPPAQRAYIANTLKCRPPRNRNPSPQEMAQCEPYLVRQIELLQPRIILAMGRFAVQALLRSDEPIGKLRGRVHRYQGVPLVVTYHPAYLLRSPLDKAKAWDDLCLAASVAEQSQA
jgi:uracil-DNA glycosylase